MMPALASYIAPEWFSNLPLINKMGANLVDYLVWPLLQIGLLLFIVLTLVAYLTLAERKISAWIQLRIGPNRVGPLGLLQPLADGIKLLIKEDLVPEKADKLVFAIAPVISLAAALVMLAVIPWGAAWATIANIDIGLLFILSVSSVGILGIILAGWASNSKYALLGALRSAAQMISYEVAMGLSLIGGLMFTKSLAMQEIVIAQQHLHIWTVLFQPMGFLIYLASAIAETNRAPFDMPEAESELVAGFHTEYSGFRFSVFFIAEYTNMLVVSAVAVAMFLGGWYLPGLSYLLNPQSILYVVASIGVFGAKTLLLLYVFFWVRWTFPRYRYDQLMALGWKWMIPGALANIVLTATLFIVGQSLGWLSSEGNGLVLTPLGYIFFIGTALFITIPLTWLVLVQINQRSRSFNLREVAPLPARRVLHKDHVKL